MTGWLDFVLLFVFLIGSGLFSGIETGIVSINAVRLRHMVKRRDKAALILQTFLKDSDRMLATTLVGTNLCNTALTVVGDEIVEKYVTVELVASLLTGVGMTIVILVFGEYLPKAWFQSHPLRRSGLFVHVLEFFSYIFLVVTKPITMLVRVMIPDKPGSNEDEEVLGSLNRKDMQYLLSRESGATPSLNEQHRRMVVGVFNLAEKTAKDVMVPRDEMILVHKETPVHEVLRLASKNQVKTFPVYSEVDKRFVGILKLSDLYQHLDDESKQLPDLMRPPQYVSPDLPADDLLPRMRLSRQPMLLVRDTADTVIGFVTTDVVLEEIVGPLYED